MCLNVLLNATVKQSTLTAKEFDLLFYLASNENIVLSRQQILDHVWEYDMKATLILSMYTSKIYVKDRY